MAGSPPITGICYGNWPALTVPIVGAAATVDDWRRERRRIAPSGELWSKYWQREVAILERPPRTRPTCVDVHRMTAQQRAELYDGPARPGALVLERRDSTGQVVGAFVYTEPKPTRALVELDRARQRVAQTRRATYRRRVGR